MNYNINKNNKNKKIKKKIQILNKIDCGSAFEKHNINSNQLNSLNSLYSIKKENINCSIETLTLSFKKKNSLNMDNKNDNLEIKYNKILNDQKNRDECFKNILRNKEILIYQQMKKIDEYYNWINTLKKKLDKQNNTNNRLQKKICKLNSDFILFCKNKKKKKNVKKQKKINSLKSMEWAKSLYLKDISKDSKSIKNCNPKNKISMTPKNKIQNIFYSNNAKSLTNPDFIKNLNIFKYKQNNKINKPNSNTNNIKKLKIIKKNKKICFNNKSNPSNLENFRNKYNDTYYMKNDNFFKNTKTNKIDKNYQSGSYLKNNKELKLKNIK